MSEKNKCENIATIRRYWPGNEPDLVRWRAAVLLADGSREVFDVPQCCTHNENDKPLECYLALGVGNIAAVAVFDPHNVSSGGRYFWFPHGADSPIHAIASERAGIRCGEIWWTSGISVTRETPSQSGVSAQERDPIRVAEVPF